ncbi:MAG: hypothetical protein C4524_05260 [Candidatus Zixiibacteriota bacterium]|nr:MAG: hypothetical protein C4524_05260 [candidate division Zixibacteria bacterium]
MKATLAYPVILAGWLILALALPAAGDNPTPPSAMEQALESGEFELLLAEAGQRGDGGPDLAAIYEQLRQMGKDYKNARSRDEKQGIANRAEELMGQLFDAKVQHEQRRLETMERRLRDEQDRLRQMQMHKRDLVHQGVQRALENGELPEWAAPQK